MSLIDDTGDCGRLLKYLADATPQGPHPEPHAEWASVRLDVVQASIDHIEWLEKGNEEWRVVALAGQKQANAARATTRVAIGHLQALVNGSVAGPDRFKAYESARDWLISIVS